MGLGDGDGDGDGQRLWDATRHNSGNNSYRGIALDTYRIMLIIMAMDIILLTLCNIVIPPHQHVNFLVCRMWMAL